MSRPQGSRNKVQGATRTATDETLKKRKAEYEEKISEITYELERRESVRQEEGEKERLMEQVKNMSAKELADLLGKK